MKSRIVFGLLCLALLGNVYGAVNNWANSLLSTYVLDEQRERFAGLQDIRDHHQQRWISEKMQAYCLPEREYLWGMVLEPVFNISTTPESRQWFDRLINVSMAGPENNSEGAKESAAPNYRLISRISIHNRAEVLSVLEVVCVGMSRGQRLQWLSLCAVWGDSSLEKWRQFLGVVRREQPRLPAGQFLDPDQAPLREEFQRIFR